MKGISQHEERLCNFSSSLTEMSVPLEIISSCMASYLDGSSLGDKARRLQMGGGSCLWYCRVTAHCREKKKKIVVFFNYRKITATQISESTEELQMGAMTAPELISSCSLMGSTSDKKQPALHVWPEDLIQLEPTSSAVNFQKLYMFQKHSAFKAASTLFSSSS